MDEESRQIEIELTDLFEAIDWADQNGLKYEFMEFFLRDYGLNKDVQQAIDYANREWDL